MQGGAVFRPVRDTAQRDIPALLFPAGPANREAVSKSTLQTAG